MDAWLPGYERTDTCGAGLNWTPGTAWKVGLHSTETGGDAVGLIPHWCQNPGAGRPHFLALNPGRIVQMLPLTVGAYTAQNPSGGVDTNRSHLIQIEVCAYAIKRGDPNRPDWRPEWYEALARWLADLVAAGVPLDLVTELTFGDRWVGFSGDYDAFGGVMGHQHIPEQPDRHWDPGELDIHRLLARARGILNPPPPKDWFDMATEDDLRRVVREENAAQTDTIGGFHWDTRGYAGGLPIKLADDDQQWLVVVDGGRLARVPITTQDQLSALRKAGVVKTKGQPFETVTQVELDSLPVAGA